MGGPNGGRPEWCRCPCGPAAPAPRRPPLTLPCAPAAAPSRPECAASRPGERPEPPPAACLCRRAPRSTPPPPAAAAGAPPRAPRLLPPPGVAPPVQVTALPRKREAERRAPGFPGLLPALSAERAGPRARDAPPRGTVPTSDHLCAAPGWLGSLHAEGPASWHWWPQISTHPVFCNREPGVGQEVVK